MNCDKSWMNKTHYNKHKQEDQEEMLWKLAINVMDRKKTVN